MEREIELLLGLLDEAFDRRSWHGTNLGGSLRGLGATQAAWRPAPGRRNVWEIAVHCAYWKYAVRRRLAGGKRAAFALAGSNWFARPQGPASESAWRRERALLADEHAALRRAVAALPARRLREKRGAETVARLIRGIAAHDFYHAGQIQLIKRLARSAPAARGLRAPTSEPGR